MSLINITAAVKLNAKGLLVTQHSRSNLIPLCWILGYLSYFYKYRTEEHYAVPLLYLCERYQIFEPKTPVNLQLKWHWQWFDFWWDLHSFKNSNWLCPSGELSPLEPSNCSSTAFKFVQSTAFTLCLRNQKRTQINPLWWLMAREDRQASFEVLWYSSILGLCCCPLHRTIVAHPFQMHL